MSTSTPLPELPHLPPAAVLYSPKTERRRILADFSEALKGRGWRVGGLVQALAFDEAGEKIGVDAIEVDTGRTLPLSRPQDKNCGLDRSILADTTSALRRAIDRKVDLMVVEKFGEREQVGDGLADEILTAMAEGIPILVACHVNALEDWNRFSGGMARLLPSDMAALWRWWGAHRLYRDLELGVDESAETRRVVVGFNWVMVEGPDGCGFAQMPARATPGCKPLHGAGDLVGRGLRDLAGLVHSWNPFETALGLAAINAHYNRFDLDGPTENGLEALGATQGPVTVIGRFPKLDETVGAHRVVEKAPRDGEYPASAGSWLMGSGEGTLVTASALVDRGLPALLEHKGLGPVALVGPGTPLTPRLFDYGLDVLSGVVIEDTDGAARAVAEGGGARDIKRHGRLIGLRGPG